MQHATSNVGRTGHQSAVIVVLLDMIDANMLANSLCTKTIEYLVVSNAFYYGCSVANDVRASTVQKPCYTAFHFTAYTEAELKIGMEELS